MDVELLNPHLADSSTFQGLNETVNHFNCGVTSKDVLGDIPSEDMNLDELRYRLQETYIKSAELETRKNLLETMVNEDLATRDIYSFLKNQAQLRIMDKRLDKGILKQAMKTKIGDVKTSYANNEREKKSYERSLRTVLRSKRHKYRKYVRALREEESKIKLSKKKAYRKKLDHYRKIQTKPFLSENRIKQHDPTIVPNRLRKYGSLCIFGAPSDLPPPLKPLGPFVCDRNIEISPEEMLILQKDPKFSIRHLASNQIFQVETEKMLAKHRYKAGRKEVNRERKKGYTGGELDSWARNSDKDMNETPSRETKNNKKN